MSLLFQSVCYFLRIEIYFFLNNITKNLVYSGSKDDVKMTVINGKILYENGEFVNIDKEEIYFNAQEVTNRLK